MYGDILVPADGSEGVQGAIDHGIEIATLADATIHALYVVDTGDYTPLSEAKWLTIEEALEAEGENAVSDVEDRALEAGIDAVTTIAHGNPSEEILAYADENDVDLIVMGTSGRSGIDRVLVGSVAENVIRRAEVPVLMKRTTVRESDSGSI